MTVVMAALLDGLAVRQIVNAMDRGAHPWRPQARYLCDSRPALNDRAAGFLARKCRIIVTLVRSSGALAQASTTRAAVVLEECCNEHGRPIRCPLGRAFVGVDFFRRHG